MEQKVLIFDEKYASKKPSIDAKNQLLLIK